MKRLDRFFRLSGFLLLLVVFLSACSGPVIPVADSAQDRAAEAPPEIPRLTGVNWFGFETGNYVVHGLWARDYRSMLKQMKDLGFNCIRIPWSNEMLDKTPTTGIQINAWGSDPYTGVRGINTDLAGLSSLQILDKIIDEADRLGLRIILDNHSREADGYYNETLWYKPGQTEEKWIADWVFMARRYRDRDNVVAYDLKNEPHGGYIVPGMKPPATWGFDLPGYGKTNWKEAAEKCALAIMAEDPDVLLVIQGVQDYEGSNYWWGSNHAGLKDYPITVIPRNRILYSVHEYGPEVHSQDWFTDPRFPANLPEVWRNRFWFIYEQKLGGLYIGEIGIKESSAADTSSIPYKWFTSFLAFAGKKVHFTVWAWNPNSGDTGGILKDDWLTVNTVKYNLIKPYLEPVGTVPEDPDPPVDPDPPEDPEIPGEPQPPAGNTGLVIAYADGSSGALTNTIAPRIRIRNSGTSTLSVDGVSLRYYWTSEPSASQAFWCDHAGGSVSGSYRDLTGRVTFRETLLQGRSRYVSIALSGTNLQLRPDEEITLQLRVTNMNWQNYDQSDDWSWTPTAGAWITPVRIPLYYEGDAVSGLTP